MGASYSGYGNIFDSSYDDDVFVPTIQLTEEERKAKEITRFRETLNKSSSNINQCENQHRESIISAVWQYPSFSPTSQTHTNFEDTKRKCKLAHTYHQELLSACQKKYPDEFRE